LFLDKIKIERRLAMSIINQDVVSWAENYKGPLFHALLSDPPYHLTSIVKRFGKPDSAPAKGGVYGRSSRGFMGQVWDGGDVAFDPETWAKFHNVLYPGAFGMAFASSRGWHRLAVAIEDAGFIIHPSIFGWLNGQGFPKATRVKDPRFDGHRYGAQALKPAVEPIIVFQQPYEGRPMDNIAQNGAGTLNIDGGRIPSEPYTINTWDDDAHPFGGGAGNEFTSREESGRWPANFVLDEGAAELLNTQSGILISGKPSGKRNATTGFSSGIEPGKEDLTGYGDSGGASRFFFNVQEQIDEADPIFYSAKASRAEREAGLEDFSQKTTSVRGGEEDDLSEGKKSTLPRSNTHPTVKPIALAKYLATLLLPPPEYSPRRIVVPFSGVSSEMIGAMQAGWEEIVGIELSEEYCRIGEARINYWKNKPIQEKFA
jgi:site-specific DNA-methyltransferase (adenine-specific)